MDPVVWAVNSALKFTVLKTRTPQTSGQETRWDKIQDDGPAPSSEKNADEHSLAQVGKS